MKDLTPLERAVLEAVLWVGLGSVDEPGVRALRKQIASSAVSREMTGVGFFTTFDVPPEVPRFPNRGRVILGGPGAILEGLQHGACFLLFCEGGVIRVLEGYSNAGETWPDGPENFEFVDERGSGARRYDEILERQRGLVRSLTIESPCS